MKLTVKIAYMLLVLLIFSCAGNKKETSGKQNVSEEQITAIKQKLNSKENSITGTIDLFKQVSEDLIETKTIEDFEFKLKYRPHLVLIIQDNDTIPSGKTIITRASEYEHLHYMTLSIENKKWHSELLKYNISSGEEYSERINYYSFKCQNDIYLIEDKDTLKGAFVNFERTFDISPLINITMAFERKKTGPFSKLSFAFDDKIFNNGKINFELDPQLVSMFNSPELKHYKL